MVTLNKPKVCLGNNYWFPEGTNNCCANKSEICKRNHEKIKKFLIKEGVRSATIVVKKNMCFFFNNQSIFLIFKILT